MKESKPMYPCEENVLMDVRTSTFIDTSGQLQINNEKQYGTVKHNGISQRLWIASMAMQGMMASGKEFSYREIIHNSFTIADYFIEKEQSDSEIKIIADGKKD